MYLVAVMDWWSRHVLAWEISNTLDSEFCVRAWERALGAGSRVPDIANTDPGAQFTSWAWRPAVDSGSAGVLAARPEADVAGVTGSAVSRIFTMVCFLPALVSIKSRQPQARALRAEGNDLPPSSPARFPQADAIRHEAGSLRPSTPLALARTPSSPASIRGAWAFGPIAAERGKADPTMAPCLAHGGTAPAPGAGDVMPCIPRLSAGSARREQGEAAGDGRAPRVEPVRRPRDHPPLGDAPTSSGP